MKIFIDMNHPAHVHFFKNFIFQMQKNGHKFQIVARQRECITDLLDAYQIPYIPRKGYTGFFKKFFGMFLVDFQLWRIARVFKPDFFIGEASPYMAHVSFLLRKPYYMLCLNEHATLENIFSMPFSKKILVPDSFEGNIPLRKKVSYNSLYTLSYLHPLYYTPQKTILAKLGVQEHERYFVLRFVAWNANHDLGKNGLFLHEKKELIHFLEQYGKVFISSEAPLDDELRRYQLPTLPVEIFDVLHYATLYIGDGASMAVEAALLGTPVIYTNPLTMGYIKELKQYKLLRHVLTLKEIQQEISSLLSDSSRQQWDTQREKLLQEKVDLTSWLVHFVETI